MKKIIKKVFAALLIFIPALHVSALEGLYGSAGGRVIFSRDEDVYQHYYKPFAKIGWTGDSIDISASYYRWISYAVTDALYNEKEIDIHQHAADITFYAGDSLSLSGGCSFMSGGSSYSALKYTGEILFDFDRIDISADGSFKKTEYEFNGTIRNLSMTAAGEVSFDIRENLSMDISYMFENTDYETYGYEYTKKSGRLGFIDSLSDTSYLIGGLTGGKDSDDVISAAFDAGFILKLYGHVKISGAYIFTVEFTGLDSVSGYKGKSGDSTSDAGTVYSHTGNIGISLYF